VRKTITGSVKVKLPELIEGLVNQQSQISLGESSNVQKRIDFDGPKDSNGDLLVGPYGKSDIGTINQTLNNAGGINGPIIAEGSTKSGVATGAKPAQENPETYEAIGDLKTERNDS
jgi:hypothetical protein